MSYYETMLLLGTACAIAAAARIFAAMVDGRTPRFSIVLLIASIGMLLYANALAPGEGMTFRDIPTAVGSLISEFR